MGTRARKRSTNASSRAAKGERAKPVPPPSEIEGLLDDVRATTIALLASLQGKERELRARPGAGAARGLSDIAALRRWADRVLHTIGILERGRSGELGSLLDELDEFREILNRRQPPIAAKPELLSPAGRS